MSEWKPTKLIDITTKIGSGATPRGGKNSYKESGITLIRSLNVYDFEFSYDGLAFIDKEQADGLSNVTVEENDILLNITGASVARCTIVPSELLPARVNQHVAIVRIDPLIAEPLFILYSINSYHYKTYLLTLAQGGATREAITKTMIENFEIALPPLPTQHKIASVLSAYDDLIETNTRRIQALEEAAQALYREWFVEFRFPGHEDVELVESELGMIPSGWGVGTLSELCHLTMGQSPKSEFYNEVGEGLPFHQGVSSYGERFPIHDRHATAGNRIAEIADILISVRAPVGRLNITDRKIIIGRGLSALRSKSGHQNFLFEQLRGSIFQEEDAMGGGTIYKSITKGDMQAIKMLKPDIDVLDEFEALIADISNQIYNLSSQNQKLREARDGLLPRLVSGEVDVSELDVR